MSKLAINALRAQIRRFAFDANLYDMGLIDWPHYKHASTMRKRLEAEIRKLGGDAKNISRKVLREYRAGAKQPPLLLEKKDGK